MIRFVTYDELLRKYIGIDNTIKSAIDNIKNMCDREEDVCVMNDDINKETPIPINNRYYILPIQREDKVRVIFK